MHNLHLAFCVLYSKQSSISETAPNGLTQPRFYLLKIKKCGNLGSRLKSRAQATNVREATYMNVIDLFCGCGGFSKGFDQAGFTVKLGIDVWEDATRTFKKNFPEATTITGDITQYDPEELLTSANLEATDVDVIIGGPPCQGFSLSGKRMLNDPRNILYKSFVRMVEYIRPKIFIMENVPGLVRLFNGSVKQQIVENFTSLGYNVEVKQLTASDYGVPQARKRVFFVGLRADLFGDIHHFDFPEATHGTKKIPFVTCEDALSDLDFIGDSTLLHEISEYITPPKSDYQRKMRKGSSHLTSHVTTIHAEKTRDIISMVPDGGNYKDLPESLRSTRKVNIAWTRMNSKKPCFTIDTGHNHHFHYRANRVPTVRESARIQSFPDNYDFLGNKGSQLKQVGNAVPPMLAEALATRIKQYLEHLK